MELCLEQFFIGQSGLVLGNERGRQGAAEGIFNNLIVLGGAQQHTKGRTFMRFAHVSVEGLQVEF